MIILVKSREISGHNISWASLEKINSAQNHHFFGPEFIEIPQNVVCLSNFPPRFRGIYFLHTNRAFGIKLQGRLLFLHIFLSHLIKDHS